MGSHPQSRPSAPPSRGLSLAWASARASSRSRCSCRRSSASVSLMVASPSTSMVKAKPSLRSLAMFFTASRALWPTMNWRPIFSMLEEMALAMILPPNLPASPALLRPAFITGGTSPVSDAKYSSMWRTRDSLVVRVGNTSTKRKSLTLKSSFFMDQSMTLPVHQPLLKMDGASPLMLVKNERPRSMILGSSSCRFTSDPLGGANVELIRILRKERALCSWLRARASRPGRCRGRWSP